MFVYILAKNRNGTLYVGVTGHLLKRVYEHKHKSNEGFTNKYNVDKLVYYEEIEDPYQAIVREKQLKKWNREWKLRLIEDKNPYWVDLYYDCRGKEFDESQKLIPLNRLL